MTAVRLLNEIVDCEPAMNQLESASNILYELYRMKGLKGTPFFAVRRAIRIQERKIKKVSYN